MNTSRKGYTKVFMVAANQIELGDIAMDTNRLLGKVTDIRRVDGWYRIETDGTVNNVNYFTGGQGVWIA